jgi:hypothetical protein
MALPTHALRAVQVRLKSVGNEGYFSLEAEKVFRPYLPSDWSGVTEYDTMYSLCMRYVQCKLD